MVVNLLDWLEVVHLSVYERIWINRRSGSLAGATAVLGRRMKNRKLHVFPIPSNQYAEHRFLFLNSTIFLPY